MAESSIFAVVNSKTFCFMTRYHIPVLLLTGYLGSGKTTLLNRILSNRRGIRFAVIVNDIGEVNIDAELIQKGGIVGGEDDSLIALQNGCICCTLKMDLVEQLRDIIAMQKFDYIVIEASGICEPEPIAQTICSMADMAPEVTKYGVPYVDCIVTVVDALRLKDEFDCGSGLTKKNIGEEDIENLVIQQIEFCNIILLNKADDVEANELGRIRQIIRGLQPKAQIIPCNYGDVELDRLLNTDLFDYKDVATSATWIEELEGHHHHDEHDDEHHHHDEHCHHHCHHHHDHDHHEGEAEEYGIGTYVYYRREPMDLGEFDQFVARLWPKNIIRAKGICYFRGEEDFCYLFEQAGKQVKLQNIGQWYATMPPAELEAMKQRDANLRRDWDDRYGDRMQKLVFIGQNLDKKAIAALLDGCLAE